MGLGSIYFGGPEVPIIRIVSRPKYTYIYIYILYYILYIYIYIYIRFRCVETIGDPFLGVEGACCPRRSCRGRDGHFGGRGRFFRVSGFPVFFGVQPFKGGFRFRGSGSRGSGFRVEGLGL